MTTAQVKKLQRLFSKLTPDEQVEFAKEIQPATFAAGASHMARTLQHRQAMQEATNDLVLFMAWISGMAVGIGDSGAIAHQATEIMDRLQRKLERIAGKNGKVGIASVIEAANMLRAELHDYLHVRGKTKGLAEYGKRAFLSYLHYINGRL